MYLNQNSDGESWMVWRTHGTVETYPNSTMVARQDLWLRQSERPAKIHTSYDSALIEAKRLAVETGFKYSLIQVRQLVIPPSEPTCKVISLIGEC